MRYKTLSIVLIIGVICVPMVYALARVQKAPSQPGQTSSGSHESVKAEIINSDPAHFTIDVHTMANMGVNEEAPTLRFILPKTRLPIARIFQILIFPTKSRKSINANLTCQSMKTF
jgi:hypothetical protein